MNKKSKFNVIAVVVLVFVMLGSVSLLASIGSGNRDNTDNSAAHIHRFGEWEGVELCLADSYERRDCAECDYYETRKVDALGHDLVMYDAKAATCTEPGWKSYTACTRCSYSTKVIIPATGCNLVNGVCTVCGEGDAPTEGLEYALSSDGTYYICTGRGTATTSDIVIASEYNGLPVAEVGERAFYGNSLTSVVIPSSVKIIRDSAFSEAQAFEKITLSEGLIELEYDAFNMFDLQGNLYLPSTLVTIGEGAIDAFDGTITVASGNQKFKYVDGVLMTSDESRILCVTSEFVGDDVDYVIPSTVRTIDEYAFYGARLNSLTIPDSITKIGSYAFDSISVPTVYCYLPYSDSVTMGELPFAGSMCPDIYVPWSETQGVEECYDWFEETWGEPYAGTMHYNYEG